MMTLARTLFPIVAVIAIAAGVAGPACDRTPDAVTTDRYRIPVPTGFRVATPEQRRKVNPAGATPEVALAKASPGDPTQSMMIAVGTYPLADGVDPTDAATCAAISREHEAAMRKRHPGKEIAIDDGTIADLPIGPSCQWVEHNQPFLGLHTLVTIGDDTWQIMCLFNEGNAGTGNAACAKVLNGFAPKGS